LREAIECQVARLCAERASDAELKRLAMEAATLDQMRARGDPHSRLGQETHLDFHRALARATGFTALAEELERVWFRRLMALNWIKTTSYKRVPEDWHQQLVQAIRTGDPGIAESKMREHVQYGHELDRRLIEQELDAMPGQNTSDLPPDHVPG
jgi:DNA-binding GntR family transcriptional regulator